ncbi:PH domain-containing protein [Actinomycetaceae bacterium MB13-C1-2]|nr:PH domain-containing protein [Actinomycetaceae bacterium MB13-C1-2]
MSEQTDPTLTGASKTAKVRAVDEGVDPSQWRRVHKITPVLNTWQAFVVILAILVFQNVDLFRDLATGEYGFSVSPGMILLAVLGGIVVILLLIIGYSFFAWRAMSYAVTDQAVWMRTGILFRQQKHVRLERIQAVDLVYPLLGRIFGLGKLTVESAGGAGGKLEIGFLATAQLDELRAEIMARAAGVYTDSRDPVIETASDALAEAPSQVRPSGPVEAPESQLYAIPTGRLFGSILVSGAFVTSIVILVLVVAALVIGAIFGGSAALFAALPTVLPVLFIAVAIIWGRFAGEFNFRAAVSPDGIRIRRGLLETRSETIPPRRVHAVRISQPFLWRKFGWYRVNISQASSQTSNDGTNQNASSVLLPVGDKREALLALWLVIPDLGVEDAEAFFDEAMHANGPSPHFVGVPRSARLFDPLTYKRKGVALTPTTMVVRGRRIQHVASFVTYERIQSQVASQGPWERARGLANVQAATVPGDVRVFIDHLASQDAASVRQIITQRSEISRGAEPPERWFSRVSSVDLSAGDAGDDPRRDGSQTHSQASPEPDDERYKPEPRNTESSPGQA